jgi:hypothetical protein
MTWAGGHGQTPTNWRLKIIRRTDAAHNGSQIIRALAPKAAQVHNRQFKACGSVTAG